MTFCLAIFMNNVNHEGSKASDVYFLGLGQRSTYYVSIKVVVA